MSMAKFKYLEFFILMSFLYFFIAIAIAIEIAIENF
jgi:hypothetical protein